MSEKLFCNKFVIIDKNNHKTSESNLIINNNYYNQFTNNIPKEFLNIDENCLFVNKNDFRDIKNTINLDMYNKNQ